ncbi:MAG: hypothetical protein DHS20C02_00480 [Micavibrio sp.]|nr:MAG: hypothetical protein DHS20C02_00480 [Micavibrio sp.]
MAEFSGSLLREKFSIHDPESEMHEQGQSVVALSNRLVVDLHSSNGKYEEKFIVRAHNMHGCVRMCARIFHTFHEGGPIMSRHIAFDWPAAWDSLVNDYEHAYNPQRWIAVYHKGRIIFESGSRHGLLDVIEQCDARNEDQYDMSVALAEDAFKQAGKTVTINYDSNVALVVTFEHGEGRCGIILRGPDRTTTFTFTAEGRREKTLSIPQCLAASAAYLEGIQLAFLIGMNNEKMRLNIIKRFSKEEKQTREAKKRLSRLAAEITNLESVYDVHYRPERPEFAVLIIEAEKLGQKILEPPRDDEDDEEDRDEDDGEDGEDKKDKKNKAKPSVFHHGSS